jgi:proteasome assembly chaperone (PAC2) family protein
MKIIVKKLSDPLPTAELLVGAVPGAGHVGKIAVDHLIRELGLSL